MLVQVLHEGKIISVPKAHERYFAKVPPQLFTSGELSVIRKVMEGKRIAGMFYEEIAKSLCDRGHLVVFDASRGHYICNERILRYDERDLFDFRVEAVRRELEETFRGRG